MTTHQITLLAGWYQVVETRADGTVTAIGGFRTAADAQEWLNTHLRMEAGRTDGAAEIFKVGYSVAQATGPAETEAPQQAETEAPATATESN